MSVTKTTNPNGSVITEYTNHFTCSKGCQGECKCITRVYPRYNEKHYVLPNQQFQVCVTEPTNSCGQPVFNQPQFFNQVNCNNQAICNSQTVQPVYNILPKIISEADNYNPFVLNPFAINSYLQTGYPANLYQVPKNKDWALVQGKGIEFEEYETGLKLNNKGVLSTKINGVIGSGLYINNTGTLQEQDFILSVNKKEFANTNGLVQEVIFNGKSYQPNNGIIFINSGASGSPITSVSSSDGSITVSQTSVGTVNLQTAKVTVRGIPTKTSVVSPKLVDLIDSANIIPNLTNDNQVSFNLTGVVKTVNNQIPDNNGNINVTTTPQGIFYQARKVLSTSDITAFQTSGVDITTMTINQGNKPSQLVGTDGVLIYVNSSFLSLDKYVRAGNIITISTSVSLAVNDSLSIVVTKSI